MTKHNAAFYKTFLLSIYKCKVDFELVLTHQKPKTRMGTYNPRLKRIRIHDGWGNEEICKEIAIHEYAHHLNHTEGKQDELGNKPHGHEFWEIYGMLLANAAYEGIFFDRVMSAFGNERLPTHAQYSTIRISEK
ncbi:MAG: hypothetical protein HUK14_11715 [Muribaculaceae bacterium]|nr:hypothetical protein [Muribaculaceae bacterium]